MLKQTMVAFTGITAGLSATLVAASPAHAEPVAAASAEAAALPNCGGFSQRDSRFFDAKLHIPSTSNDSGDYNCVLGVGNQGIAVKKLQDALVRCHNKNLGPSGIDGKYGTYTRNAVWSIQDEFGLPRGDYGPQTKAKMGWLVYPNGGGNPTLCERAAPLGNVSTTEVDRWRAS
jgi:putative peptidoglycan binding protein